MICKTLLKLLLPVVLLTVVAFAPLLATAQNDKGGSSGPQAEVLEAGKKYALLVGSQGTDWSLGRLLQRPNGPRIFADDFAARSPRPVSLFGEQVMSFAHVSGQGRLVGTSAGILPAMYEGQEVKDFFAEFEFRVPSPRQDSGYGIVFRSDDAENGLAWYYALLFKPATPSVLLACWKDATWAVAQEYPLKSDLLSNTRMNHVRLEAVGPEIRVFINRTLIVQLTDQTIDAPGIFGLCVSSATAESDAVFFDNLRIYEPSAEAR